MRLVDAAGVLGLDSRQAVRFDLAGAGELVDNQGTARDSRKVDLANGRARIWFRRAAGASVVSVAADGVAGALLTIAAPPT